MKTYKVYEQLPPVTSPDGWEARLEVVGQTWVRDNENPIQIAREITGIQFPIVEEITETA